MREDIVICHGITVNSHNKYTNLHIYEYCLALIALEMSQTHFLTFKRVV